ncbi:MAG: HK97 gp10 family phage protein [Thermoleophilia bacterium]|nr:HK97 gp10 family phage protein [Thermoleophilia bacterium]
MSPRVRITIDTSGLDLATAEAKAVFQEELQAACIDIGDHVSGRVKRIIEEEEIRYTSTLMNSITWSLIEETVNAIGVAVGTNILYAKYVEYGTVPHFVPFHLAKTLYDQAVADWGWLKVDTSTSADLNARPSNKVRRTRGGMFTITGKHQTYLTRHPERLWLQPGPGAKPVWGVVVSGRAQPFLWPGWEASLEYCEHRLNEAVERTAARLGGP